MNDQAEPQPRLAIWQRLNVQQLDFSQPAIPIVDSSFLPRLHTSN